MSSLCRTFARSYVDRGHPWEENEHCKTVLTLLLLWLNGRSYLLLYIDWDICQVGRLSHWPVLQRRAADTVTPASRRSIDKYQLLQ